MAALALAFVALPLATLLARVPWRQVPDHLTTPAATQALALSLWTSAAATVAVVALGLPLAWVLARHPFPGRSLARGLVLLPMVLPPVVGGVALLSAFSRRAPLGGWLHDTFGIQLTFHPAGTVLAQTFVALPFFVLSAEAALTALDPRLEEAAAELGASRLQILRRVTLPLIAPSIAAGAVLAWARALGEFGATTTFAGNVAGRTRTLPLTIYQALETDRGAALTLSAVLVACCLVVLVALRGHWQVRP